MGPAANETRIGRLLAELSAELGFSLAAREPACFLSLVEHGVDAFTDGVFAAEGLDPGSEKRLRSQVRSLVGRHFAAWDASGAA